MCSIDEAWAGQKFEGSPVVSQSDIRQSYMSIPNNLMDMNNQFSINQTHDPSTRYTSRGINSQLSRVPRVPVTSIHTNDNNTLQFSSTMPTDIPPYLGEAPRPHYMQVYDQAGETNNIPMPSSMRDNFGDFNTVFDVSDTVNSFMGKSNTTQLPNTQKIKTNTNNNNYLLNENNNDNRKTIQKKYNSMQEYTEIKTLMGQVLKRLDSIESQLHIGQKNPCDMTLYILIGLLLAFLIYSVFISISKK